MTMPYYIISQTSLLSAQMALNPTSDPAGATLEAMSDKLEATYRVLEGQLRIAIELETDARALARSQGVYPELITHDSLITSCKMLASEIRSRLPNKQTLRMPPKQAPKKAVPRDLSGPELVEKFFSKKQGQVDDSGSKDPNYEAKESLSILD